MGIQGNIRDMSVADLIQHNCSDRKKAKLVIICEDKEAALYFKDGNVVHATLENAEGEEVIYQVLAWEEGTFTLTTNVDAPKISIERSWSGLLMEGARLLDEQKFEPEMVISDKKEKREVKMAQNMEEVLEEMSTEMNGFMAGAVAGLDGMNIAQISKGKTNPESVTAQLTIFLKLASSSNEKSGMGVMEDLLIQTENVYIMNVYLPGDKQHFLITIADRKTGSLGNMRLISKIYADRLSKVIPR